ncbi:helicase-associated domain-containing protein [Saccharothrix sp. ST-888]|uniref:helicase-associated domain-containing protein n=1 Tax=Saccharothrix sp. ST-888 TaxID=1427391 RepID=UPI0012E0470C|nr:helicase-associated domain-containing protein [Saccharothrix sp. ST-888]
MKTARSLAAWLADRSPSQLAELLEQRELPFAGRVESMTALADHLLTARSVGLGLREIDLGDLQLLNAVAVLAERLHGPLPGAVRTPHQLAGYGGYSPRPELPAVDPAKRSVTRAELFRFLELDADGRAAAEAALSRLAERALVLPPSGSKVVVPILLHRQARETSGYGRPVDQLLTEAYNAPEVHRIAQALGLGKVPTRDEAQRRIVAALSDAERARSLAAEAPPAARELLDRLVPGPPLLRTHCFVSRYGFGYSDAGAKYLFREGGSGDPGTDWLAARGLVLPVGADLAELPYEVSDALRDHDRAPRYEPVPPAVAGAVEIPGAVVDGQAQAAMAEAVSRVELMLRSVAEQPLAVRKTGGIAVRDTRRLSKAVGVPEEQARLWLDLATNADLLIPHAEEPESPAKGRGRARRTEPSPPVRMLPTERYEAWLASSPAQRMLPLVATWAVVPEVFTHWPDEDDTPVALVSPQDAEAVELRRAVLEALATLPAGRGIARRQTGRSQGTALAGLIATAAWFRPAAVSQGLWEAERVEATLAEAELLGVVAHGALSPVGQAVLGLLRAGAHRHFPAVPGAGPALRDHPALDAAVRHLSAALDSTLPAPQTTARFQADLTAVVAGAAAPELTDLLACCADRESEGHAVVWRITPAAVRRALNAGTDAADLLARLAEVSEGGRPLPQPLEYLIKDTARTHGRMRVVRSACCIRSDDEALVLELSKARALSKLGLRRIAPTVLISTAEPEATLGALRAAGYAPAFEAETGTTIIERARQDRGPSHMPPLSRQRPHHGGGPGTAQELAVTLLTGR